MLQVINNLIDTGVYKQLYAAGLISPKVMMYRDIYFYVTAQMQARNINQAKAIISAEVQFSVSERTVKRALATFAK